MNSEYIAQTLVWTLVSVLTSIFFRVSVDRKVLYTGETVSRIALGGASRGDVLRARELAVITPGLFIFAVCAAVDTARPGSMGFAWMFFLASYMFIVLYLSMGWLTEKVRRWVR